MKINLVNIFLSYCFIFCIVTGCKKETQTEPLVGGDLRVDLLGDMTPQALIVDKDQFAIVNFVGSNLKYRFDLNRIDANHYYGMLANAQKTSSTVKIWVTKRTEIIRIEQ